MEAERKRSFRGLCWTCVLAICLPALLLFFLGGWSALGLALFAILAPIAGYAPGLLGPRKLPPMYARAIARMKFGKYSEAEWEILRELEKCEDDFDGWMMLADLYANHFNDLPAAEQTVLELCDNPRTTPSQFSVALHPGDSLAQPGTTNRMLKHALGDSQRALRLLQTTKSVPFPFRVFRVFRGSHLSQNRLTGG